MNRIVLVLSVLVLSVAIGGNSPVPTNEDLIKQMIPDAKDLTTTGWKLTPERKARIEAAVGQPLSDAESVIYRLKADLPVSPFRRNVDITAGIFTVKGPKGEIKFGAGFHAYKEGKYFYRILTHLKIFEHKESKGIESPEFLLQFLGVMYGPGLETSAAGVKKTIDGLAGADQEAIKAAMAVYGGMQQTDALWTSLRNRGYRKDKGGAADTEQLIKVFENDTKAAAKLNFLAESERRIMTDQYRACIKELGAIAQAFKNGNLGDKAAFDNMLKSTRAACDGCHRVVENKFHGYRSKNKIAGQACLVGCDIYAPAGADADACQALATGVKKAILILFWSNPDALK